jgi:enterochelin esterase-like enzyme
MLEPQSTVFFVLLLLAFAGLVWWMLKTRHLALRIVAAFLAFVPAMLFGVATVNKYYDYYQTWGSAVADFTAKGVAADTVPAGDGGSGTGFSALVDHHVDTQIAGQYGLTLKVTVHGPVSHLSRTVYVFLPPQYFQAAYQHYRFPAVELIHGFPGQPQDWITVLGVNTLMDSLVSEDQGKPAVLVMPDANGPRGVSLQCLNQVNGPQDDTFLSEDVPNYIAAKLRVQPPGAGWGVAGYSEGGFCAANLALQHRGVYSFAGVLSGYFRPSPNQLINPVRSADPFADQRQRELNTPIDELRSLPLGRPLPQFWLGAGLLDAQDVHSALNFSQLLQLRQPGVTVKMVPGDGHTMVTWRRLLPTMMTWMTRGLAQEVTIYNSPAAVARRSAATRSRMAQLDRGHSATPRPGSAQPRQARPGQPPTGAPGHSAAPDQPQPRAGHHS